MLKYEEIMGFNFVNNSMDEFVGVIEKRMQSSQKTFIVTANPEIVTYAQLNPSYEDALNKADYIIPDGVGITLASKLLNKPLQERIAGFDFMTELLKVANLHKSKVYFLGTKPKVIDLTVTNVHKAFPNIEVVGFHHGYFSDDELPSIIEEIKVAKPDIVFVGLGFPKQEKWIAQNHHHFNKGIFIGLGGCFNVWAGVVNRAPKFWRNLNLEWAYRIMKEPTRLKRAVAIPKFVFRVFHVKYRKNSKKGVSKI